MINFYKQDGIGKIAFNDGNIYVPQGNVTLLLDTTTEKIIVAEDERLIYWISLSQPLEVNGTQISGTDAEKLALIAPVFQNEGGGGTGGGSGATPSLQQVTDIGNTTDKDIFVVIAESRLSTGSGEAGIGLSNDDTGDYSGVGLDANGGFVKVYQNADSGVRFGKIRASASLTSNREYVLPNASGEVALVPTQSFDSNAEAVTALGVGMLYKSTTLINGSPIILITV